MENIKIVFTKSKVVLSEQETKLSSVLNDLYGMLNSECNLWLCVDRSKTIERINQLSIPVILLMDCVSHRHYVKIMIKLAECPLCTKHVISCFRIFKKNNKKETLRKQAEALSIYKDIVTLFVEYLESSEVINGGQAVKGSRFDYDKIRLERIEFFESESKAISKARSKILSETCKILKTTCKTLDYDTITNKVIEINKLVESNNKQIDQLLNK